jgi:hypothetical protein
MPRRHLSRLAAGLAAAACVIGIPAAAAASPAAGTINITFAGNPSSSEPTVLQVDANATTAISSLTASLLSAPGGTDVYDVTDLTLASGSTTDGIWTATLPAGTVPAGTYTVSVSATDTGGDSLTVPDAGSFAFLDQPTLTATMTSPAVTYQDQTVDLSGQLTATPAGGGTTIDEGGVPIYYSTGSSTAKLFTTTGSDGTFSGSIPYSPSGAYTLTASASSTMAAASTTIYIESFIESTLVRMSVSPARLSYGQHTVVHGVATYQDFSTSKNEPLADSEIQIYEGGVELPSVTTNSAGDFSTTIPATYGDLVQVNAGISPLLTESSAFAYLKILKLPLAAKTFTAKIEGNGGVASSLCLKVNTKYVLNFGAPTMGKIELEYAPRRQGPWKKLGFLTNAGYGVGSCSGYNVAYYSDTLNGLNDLIPGRLISAYYRVYYGGSSAFTRFTSKLAHSAIGRSRITSFNVSPRSVYDGDHFKITGRLEHLGRSWSAYGHRVVDILARVPGTGWSLFESARTNSRGSFTATGVALSGRGVVDFKVLYPGDSHYLWSQTGQISVSFNGGAVHRARMASIGLGGYLRVTVGRASLPRLVPLQG